MPLHLLHHKSYNVYSTTNIERVRRDEAAARAKEEAEEQRMQEADAEHRVKVLRARARGEAIPSLEENSEEPTISGKFIAPRDSAQAKEGEAVIGRRPTPPPPAKHRKASPRLIGPDGHINLFSDLESPHPKRNIEKNAEYEAEKKAKEDKLEAQYTMGLGKPADELRPWYSTLDMVGEIKGRKKSEWETKKESRRKDWGDPLVAIRRGVRGVKEVEEERKEWKRSRELEVGALGLDVLGAEGSDRVKRARTRGRSQEYRSSSGNHDQNKYRGRSRNRSRSRSRSRSRRHHHSHRHNKRESSTEPTPHRHRQHITSRSRSRRHRSPSEDTMKTLRRERDRRERDEREKAERMLKKEKEYHLPGWKAANGGRYSSQFGIGEVRKR